MKRKNMGFTLVELLVTLVVLGILMAVAVPNVMGILSRNRNNTYIEDAKRLATTAEYRVRGSTEIVKPVVNGACIILSLEHIDNSEFESPPNDGEYLRRESYVVVKKNNNLYKYFVQLIEELPNDKGYRGVQLADIDSLYEDSAYESIVNLSYDELVNVSEYTSNPNALVNSKINNLCSAGIEKIYG